MLTDWLIFLDLLEENNCNTSFLRLITPITFGIIESHYYNYDSNNGHISSYSYGHGYGNGYISGDGFGNSFGNGHGFSYDHSNSYDEEH